MAPLAARPLSSVQMSAAQPLARTGWAYDLYHELSKLSGVPFLNTSLGRLPPEIRVIIWEYVLIAPLSVGIAVNPDYGSVAPSPGQEASDTSQALDSPPSAVLARRLNSVSRCALLETCRLIHRETQLLIYGGNSFHFANASSLLGFLTCIGGKRRQELQVLHIDGLTYRKSLYSEEELDEKCRNGSLGRDRRQHVAALRYSIVHPDAAMAARRLEGCNGVRKIFLNLKAGEEYQCICFLAYMHKWRTSAIDFVDAFHWVVRPCGLEDSQILSSDSSLAPRARPDPTWGGAIWGNRRCVEVDIVRDVPGNR